MSFPGQKNKGHTNYNYNLQLVNFHTHVLKNINKEQVPIHMDKYESFPLLLRGASDYSIDTVSELMKRYR